MKNSSRFFVALIALLLLASFSACSLGGIVMSSETPEPTLTAVPTPTPTATPSPTPTVEPTPTPTPRNIEAKAGIKKGQDKVEAEVNQRFEGFLDGKGEYTDELISETGFAQYYSNKKDIGCIDAYEATFVAQGVLLHYERVLDGEIFAFGVKNENGNRIITLIEIPSQISIKYKGRVAFWAYPDSSLSSKPNPKYFGLRDDTYYDFLKSLVGKVIIIDIKTRPVSESSVFDLVDDDTKKVLTESIDPKVEANLNYVTNVYFVDDNDHQLINSSEYIKQLFEAEEGSLVAVSNYDEFEEFLKNVDFCAIPSSLGIGFVAND